MRWARTMLAALLLGPLAGVPAVALDPGEALDDPKLEARAREITKTLRCPVCQNQSIDDSDAPLAKDLRRLVRERLKAGDSDAEAVAFVTDRYGDFVLLRPPVKPATWLLWFGPLALFLVAAGLLLWRLRRRRAAAPVGPAPLSEAERRRMAELLGEDREEGRDHGGDEPR